MTRIRVRVNPADADEYAIYADADDGDGQWWLGQRSGGRWTGWEHNERVVDWPEFELTIPSPGYPVPTVEHTGGRGDHPARR